MKSNFLRSLQGLLAVSSFFFLTAAKGQGCKSTEVLTEPPTEPAPICAEGTHLETVCDEPVFRCGTPPFPEDDGDIAVGEPGCHDECVPDDVCPPGMVEEWFCGESEGDIASPACDGPDCAVGIGTADCQVSCVPAQCPAGTVEQWTCAISEDDEPDCAAEDCAPPAEPVCELSCVPAGCPEGTVAVEQCNDNGDEAICSIVCEPIEPTLEE